MKSGFPPGSVTFFFTDIEDSTRISQQKPDAMSFARARHNEILKIVIESNDGYVFQMIGDAFCAAFHTARSRTWARSASARLLFETLTISNLNSARQTNDNIRMPIELPFFFVGSEKGGCGVMGENIPNIEVSLLSMYIETIDQVEKF